MENNIITMEERKNILADMKRLLSEYEYDFTESALNKIIDTWAMNKAKLISLFKNHPNYIEGKFMITFSQNWSREINSDGAYRFLHWIKENAKTIEQNFPDYVKEKAKEECELCGYDIETFYVYNILTPFTEFLIDYPDVYAHQYVNEATAKKFNNISPSMRFKEGQKMSRAINKICTWLGINKLPDYNKEFAKYADSVNPLKIVRHTIISLNPLDYLTMSFGNSWASCHTIDKENYRDMPNSYEGQYSSGTISYMLDKVSMVFYTVSADYSGDKFYFQDKINRNMFHYGEDKLIQGRVYPQDNDSNADGIYKDIREIVQRVIADCLGIPNYWATKKGPSEIGDYVCSDGTNYKDYCYYDNCCISFPKGKEINTNRITIGHDPICIWCGREHQTSENINHCANMHECEGCGRMITENEEHWVGNYRYCEDCITTCECCGREVVNEDARHIESEDRYVCENCLDNHYIYCEECEEYVRSYNATWVDNEDRWVCDSCWEEINADEEEE